jgi:hypothetical protein
MQCACAMFSSVGCPALQNFSTLYYNWQDFRKELYNIKYILILSFIFFFIALTIWLEQQLFSLAFVSAHLESASFCTESTDVSTVCFSPSTQMLV